MPTDACAYQKAIICWEVLQDLAELRLHTFSGKPCGLIKQLNERGPLERQDAQFCKDFLLTNPQMQCARSEINRSGARFYDRLRIVTSIVRARHERRSRIGREHTGL